MKLGILGAGQLGRMLALAGYPLGVRCLLLDPTPNAPGSQVAEQIVAGYGDPSGLARLAECGVVTYEFESVPAAAAEWLSSHCRVLPPPKALEVAQDRLHEKSCFRSLGIRTPEFADVSSLAGLTQAVARLGLPAVLKTRTFGYDGKGQFVLRSEADVEPAFAQLGGVPLILEAFVAFDRELSLLAVRGSDGATAYYPLVQNEHRNGILHLSLAPASGVDAALQRAAETYANRLLDELGYVGVLALELFEKSGELIANEIAPRVHNSGHWTLEGAETSQFENHLRAILGLPLGATATRGYAAMLNLVGSIPDPKAVLAVPGAHLHLYGKEPRPGRKVGHVTLCCNTAEERCERIDALLRVLDR
jgi:5-(carboxyamino)imidazole ribonucleotide synthase